MQKQKVILLVSIAAFLIGTVFFAIEAATSGAEVAALEHQEALLVSENKELADQVMEFSSLSSVEGKAGELNFVKPEKVVYLNGEETIAKIP